MSDQLHATIRHVLTVVGVLIGVYLVVPAFHHSEPAPNGAIVGQVNGIARTVNDLMAAERLRASLSGQAPAFAAPAVSVIRELVPQSSGMTDAQIGAMLSALKPKYVTQVAAQSHLVSATPMPLPSAPPGFTPEQGRYIYEADKNALQTVLNDPATKIHTEVSISQVEAPPSRIGTVILGSGDSGLGYAVLRRKQLDLELAGVQAKGHVSPAVLLDFRIPHTQLGIGVGAEFNHGVRYGFAASIKL